MQSATRLDVVRDIYTVDSMKEPTRAKRLRQGCAQESVWRNVTARQLDGLRS